MSLEQLQDAVRAYVETGGKLGPDRNYNEALIAYYQSEYTRTYGALEGIFKKTGKFATMARAAEFIRNDTAKARGLGGKEAVSGDAGADAAITFCMEKLKVKFPGLKVGK